MTTVAYCAVAPEGRTERHQLYWRRRGDARAAAAHRRRPRRGSRGLRADRPRRPGRGRQEQPAARARAEPDVPAAEPAFTRCRDAQRTSARRVAAHADAARMAMEAGFDAVEIHLGHNYLASAFLSPRLNRRARRVRRQPGEPRPVPAGDRPRGARRRRRPDRDRWPSSTWTTACARGLTSTRRSRSRGGSRPTARSTRWR